MQHQVAVTAHTKSWVLCRADRIDGGRGEERGRSTRWEWVEKRVEIVNVFSAGEQVDSCIAESRRRAMGATARGPD